MRLAEDYAPKVINNINVGGVQQILLKVKVMEISRTKLRQMATDFVWLDSNGSFFATGVSRLLQQTSNGTGGFQTVVDTAGKAAEFGIVGDNGAFFGFIDWLQQNQIAKILSEPNIVAVSGRPAQFIVGGEIPIVVPQSLGTASIEYKPFGTQIDFLPIVLGNGNIRLEVRPRVSELDPSNSVIVQDFVIPALTVRHVDTAVEMKAGQTFALAGLVQERTESLKRGLPYVSDWPIVGLPFRRVQEEVNEIELLIVVTPEFVDPIDACEAPHGGPGTYTTSPNNCDLYCGGKMEVPNECNPIRGLNSCGQVDCNGGMSCETGNCHGESMPMITDGVEMPGGIGYDESSAPTMEEEMPPAESDSGPADLQLPEAAPAPQEGAAPSDGVRYLPAGSDYGGGNTTLPPREGTAPSPYSPPRTPVFMRNASRPHNPHPAATPPQVRTAENGLIGPIGYDVQ
jgi:pilus assembly protein CpaC